MGQAIPRQHPAVVLRSHFNQLRALLAVAMVAVVGLTVAVVILATDDDRGISTGSATQVNAPSATGSTRYDGGPEEGTRGVAPARQPNVDARPGVRYDGGPEEGTADVTRGPRVTQQQASPGVAGQAEAAGAQSGSSSSQSGTKDYSLNGATGDVSPEPQAQSGSRADGAPEEGLHLQRPGSGN
jgi:hypothetical protein